MRIAITFSPSSERSRISFELNVNGVALDALPPMTPSVRLVVSVGPARVRGAASDGSRFDRFQFSGAVGQTVTIQMTSSAFDTLLLLLDPSENPVAVNDDASRSVTNSLLTFTPTSSGPWTIVANSLNPTGVGDYFISATLDCPVIPSGPKRRAVRR